MARSALAARRMGRSLGKGLTRVGLPPLPALLSLAPFVFLLGFLAYSARIHQLWEQVWYTDEVAREALLQAGIPTLMLGSLAICSVLAVLLLVGITVGRIPSPAVLSYLRKCCIVAYGMCAVVAFSVFRTIGVFAELELTVLQEQFDSVVAFYWRWQLLWPLGALFIFMAIVHLISWRRRALNYYFREELAEPAAGDAVIESVRSDGQDPVYRRSMYGSLFSHFALIIGIPWIMQFWGCVEPYRIPKGSGNPAVTLVTMVKPPEQQQQKLILNADSAIIYIVPDLEQSQIQKQVDVATQKTYTADAQSVHGVGGQPGQTAGWPDGMDGAEVRFIRLQYRGVDWDDGMDAKHRADMNFLEAFHQRTGFKIADRPEANRVSQLGDYRPGEAPPFVYMTGSGGISIGSGDRRILREYLLGGGMLFADAGSPQWDRAFRSFMASLFPDKPLITISDDDPIYGFPYHLPGGAPPLWHHGGMKALGVKHQGRYVVYYHPGDIGDAWVTGHSGLRPELVEAAFDLGVNIVYYSFTNYLQQTRKYRK